MNKNPCNVKPFQPFIKLKNETGSEDIHYSAMYESLPPEFEAVAAKELNETPSGREDGLRKLREYMKKKNIPMMKEHLLLAVLRNCKYDMKKSETKIKQLYSTRNDFIKLLQALDMKKIEKIIDDMGLGMLPYRDKQGRVIFYTRPYAAKIDFYSVHDVATVYAAAHLFALSYPLTSVTGIVYFGEAKSDTLYLLYDIFGAIRKYLFTFLSLPIRISRIEILNENYVCRCFIKFMKTILSKKITERLCLHGSNYDHFLTLYNPDILPAEFGGKTGPISNEAYREKFLDFIQDLRNHNY